MGYSYERLVDIIGKKKADALFDSKQILKKTFKLKDPYPEYTKLCETAHAKLFHKWLKDKGIIHTHIGNEAGQAGTKNIVIMMAKKKSQGTSKGFPDYVILLPIHGGYNITLYIELKKAKTVNGGANGSSTSQEQEEWGKSLTKTVGSFWEIAYGSEDAKAITQRYIDKYSEMALQYVFEEWCKYNIFIN